MDAEKEQIEDQGERTNNSVVGDNAECGSVQSESTSDNLGAHRVGGAVGGDSISIAVGSVDQEGTSREQHCI